MATRPIDYRLTSFLAYKIICMPRKEQLQPMFHRLLSGLSPERQQSIRIVYDAGHPLREKTDLLIYVGNTLMAAGNWSPFIAGRLSTIHDEAFTSYCSKLMSLESIPWYLFEFDGEHLLIYDLSEEEPRAIITADLIRGIRQLCTVPTDWKNQQHEFTARQQYVQTLLSLLREEKAIA